MKSDKHLYFFTANFPFGKGEQFIEIELPYLTKYFSKITIIPYSFGGCYIRRFTPADVEIVTPLFEKNKLVVLLKEIFNFSPLLFFFSQKANSFNCFIFTLQEGLRLRKLLRHPTLRSILKNKEEKIFYFYWSNMSGNIVPFIKKKIKTIVRFHRGDLYEYLPDNNCGFYNRKEQLKNINYCIFISSDGEKYLKQRYYDVSFTSTVFRLGVKDYGISKQSQDNVFRLVSCSFINKEKRIELIIEILKKISFEVEWIHFGDGPLMTQIQSLSQKLSSNIRCIFKGYQPNDTVRQYYINNPIDLFINVSSNEGVPVSIMEALSSGIPVFATNVGGTSELVDESVGTLMDANIDTTDIAERINKYYNSGTDYKKQTRNNARKRWFDHANADILFDQFGKFLSEQ
jgi:glycosyltransferase involved in cell wall biosynthesis